MNNENAFKPEVTSSFLSSGDVRFKSIVGDIVTGTVDNAYFPISQPKAKLVQERYAVYAPLVLGPGKRSSESAAARKDARTALEEALRDLLPAIQAESGNSLVKLLTTNIPLARNKEVVQMPTTPTEINLFLYGNPLLFYAQCEAQSHAKIYEAQVSRDKVTWPWQKNNSKSAVPFTDLPTGELLYVQMRVKNTVGTSEWSTPLPFTIPAEGVAVPQRRRPRGVK